MKPIIICSFVLIPYFCFSQYTYNHLQVNFLQSDTIAKAYTYGNLRLYPVYAKESFTAQFKTVGKYMSLQEALQKGKVKVKEKPGGGTVNTLTIENISNDTVIVICGDVVKGGQQDRIVEKDVVLKPKSGKKELKVFCVESGRWHANSERATASRSNFQNNDGPAEFKEHYNKGSMGLRKVVEKEKEQSRVWSKVEEVNTKNATLTPTKTYTALTSSKAYTKKLDDYLKFFRNKFA